MEKRTHDYKDTIAESAELDNAKSGKFAAERVKRAEAEAAYEALAVTSSMGMLGMEQTTANLLQLELAQELAFKYDEIYNAADDDGEYHVGD